VTAQSSNSFGARRRITVANRQALEQRAHAKV